MITDTNCTTFETLVWQRDLTVSYPFTLKCKHSVDTDIQFRDTLSSIFHCHISYLVDVGNVYLNYLSEVTW